MGGVGGRGDEGAPNHESRAYLPPNHKNILDDFENHESYYIIEDNYLTYNSGQDNVVSMKDASLASSSLAFANFGF